MALDIGSLEPHIYRILSAPGTDLGTISAKRVRKQLQELDPTLTADILKAHKNEVDAVIASVFERVSGGQGTASDEGGTPRTKGEADEESPDDLAADDMDLDESNSPTPKKKKKGTKQEQADAELARKLSSEINGRSTRTGGKGRGGSGTNKKAARTKKSAATVNSDDDSANEGGKKKTRKKSSSGTGAKGGFAKEFSLSEPLSAVLQVDKLSRPQVVKHLWNYIKGRELQNPGNKREILCDPSLRAVFGVEKIDMFKMNKVLGQHLHEIE
ncbi:SWIB/MDM2 domain-containing protein [Crepidotus variabilis]|uniref:SWIB/MDM2 domain-containing protein n=1 Tax=Crepidotus variabilis TaxID=179855 RepID=A0A9P6JNB1_9AGAR|nr:SWIB/MDM2 domain-containing protein [Crepidotus variabilis]